MLRRRLISLVEWMGWVKGINQTRHQFPEVGQNHHVVRSSGMGFGFTGVWVGKDKRRGHFWNDLLCGRIYH